MKRTPLTLTLLCLLLPHLAFGGGGFVPPPSGTLFAPAEVAKPPTLSSPAGWKTFASLTVELVMKVAKRAWQEKAIMGQWTLEERQCAYAKFALFALEGMSGAEFRAPGPGMEKFYSEAPATQKWLKALKNDWCKKKGTERKHDDDDDDNDDPGNKGVQLAIYYTESIRKAEGGSEMQKAAAVKAAAATTIVAGVASFFAILSNILIPIPGVIPVSPTSPPPGFNSGT